MNPLNTLAAVALLRGLKSTGNHPQIDRGAADDDPLNERDASLSKLVENLMQKKGADSEAYLPIHHGALTLKERNPRIFIGSPSCDNELKKQFRTAVCQTFGLSKNERELLDTKLDRQSSYLLAVVRRGNRKAQQILLIGGLLLEPRMESKPPQMIVVWLVVADVRFRSKGVGQYLVKAAVELSRQLVQEGNLEIITASDKDNEEAIKFWEGKMRFRKLQIKDWEGDRLLHIANDHNYYLAGYDTISDNGHALNVLYPLVRVLNK